MPEQDISIDKQGSFHQDAEDGYAMLTTDHGVPISNNQSHLRIGQVGPMLMEDFHFREKLCHFNHERIPERVVHARGYGAHGYFETTAELSAFTKAHIFQRKHEITPVFVRFSTVAGSKGSADLVRDARGFAVKFYTKEGNWDLVGNNIPVFFIQDPIKFPDLIHALKEDPDRAFPQAQSAHDNFWDFISLSPESMHMLMWVMSDRTLPRSFRFMDGFGVHTFRFVDQQGKSTYVKFHWKPKLGVQSVVWDEALKINGADPDFHRRDLWNAINQGDFPEWELGVQLFDEKFAESFEFSVLDPTKLIPEEVVPIKIVGRLVLDRVVENFFAETEQVAFLTHNIVPGIDFTDDPLLQGRNFAYLDAQLKRLGSPNFAHLPINMPNCPMHVFHQDGYMALQNRSGNVNYEPNSWGTSYIGGPRESHKRGFQSIAHEVYGQKLRVKAEAFVDHYSQARQFYISQTRLEQKHIADALTFELSKVATPLIRERMVGHLLNIDKELAITVCIQLGMSLPPAIKPAKLPNWDLPKLPSLSIMTKLTVFTGRKLGVLTLNGADAGVFKQLVQNIHTLKATVEVIAPQITDITLSDQTMIKVDHFIGAATSGFFDAIVILLPKKPEERAIPIPIPLKPKVAEFVIDALNHFKFIGYTEALLEYLDTIDLRSQIDAGCFELNSTEAINAFCISLHELRFWKRELFINA